MEYPSFSLPHTIPSKKTSPILTGQNPSYAFTCVHFTQMTYFLKHA